MEMEKHEVQSGKVVRLYPAQSTPVVTNTIPPPEPISEDVARAILRSQLTKVAGVEPVRGGALVLVAVIAVLLVALSYSLAAS